MILYNYASLEKSFLQSTFPLQAPMLFHANSSGSVEIDFSQKIPKSFFAQNHNTGTEDVDFEGEI